LDLLEWEEASLKGLLEQNVSHPVDRAALERTCRPPDGISRSCCLGSFSAGGGVTDRFRHQCVAPMQTFVPIITNGTNSNHGHQTTKINHQHGHTSIQQATKAFFQDNALPPHELQRCDVCQILDLARHQNLTVAFLGDSMHAQVFDGLMCELERRNYNVTVDHVDRNPQKLKSYPYRRHSYSHVLHIQSTAWPEHQQVTLQYHMMYLLPLIDDSVLEMTAQADVVVLGFGLHWYYSDDSPLVLLKRQSSYVSAMRDLFHNITNQGHVKLLVHRETSAQHFDADGGEFSLWWNQKDQLRQTCQPMNYNDTSVGWRETSVQQAIQQAGHQIIMAGPSMPPLQKRYHQQASSAVTTAAMDKNNDTRKYHRSQQQATIPEVVVLPYFHYTSRLYSLHPIQDNFQDCTHFCSSPFLYYPLWRSLRFAMDRQFGGGLGN